MRLRDRFPRAHLSKFLSLMVLATASLKAQTAERPLPDIHSVLVKAAEVIKNSDDKFADYEHIEIESGSGWTSDRDVSKEIVSIIYSVQGVGISRELLKDRSPITSEMQQKLDRDVEKTIRAGLKPKTRKDDDLQDWSMLDLEKVATLSDMQRIRRQGRDLLKVHLEGNPKARSVNLMQKFESHLTGTLVFDEEDGALKDVDVVLNSDVSFMLIAKGKKGMKFKMSYLRLAPNNWQQESIEADGHFTYFFHNLAGHFQSRHYGYQAVPRRLTDPYRALPYAALSPQLKQEIEFCLEAFDSDVNEGLPG